MMYTYLMEPQIPVTLSLGFAQIQAIVDQLGLNEQKCLTEYLERKTLHDDLRVFRAVHRDFPLSLDEIQAEVKFVRREQVARGHRS